MPKTQLHSVDGRGATPGLIPTPGTAGFPIVLGVIVELGILVFLRKWAGKKGHGG